MGKSTVASLTRNLFKKSKTIVTYLLLDAVNGRHLAAAAVAIHDRDSVREILSYDSHYTTLYLLVQPVVQPINWFAST